MNFLLTVRITKSTHGVVDGQQQFEKISSKAWMANSLRPRRLCRVFQCNQRLFWVKGIILLEMLAINFSVNFPYHNVFCLLF